MLVSIYIIKRTLLDDRHNDDEIADRLKRIDADIHAME